MRLALYEPDIPQNLGAFIRLSAGLGVPLDVIEPCGFPVDDKRIRRAAMDYYDLATLESMHARLRQLVAEQGGEVGLIVHCPHGPDDGCDCRKPKPGMLKQIAAHYATELAGIWFVGDTGGDLQAALAVDCQPVLVKTGKGERTLAKPLPPGTLVFDDLAAVADQLLS